MPFAQALDWKFEPSVGASATYTDNVRQSATNEDDAIILRVTPGFTLRSEGSRRVQATLQYGLSGVARLGDDSSNNNNDLIHTLNAAGKAELVEDFLFIEGKARISQELISLLGSPASADVNASNRANVGTYLISPYVQKRLGTFANAQARYTASGAMFGKSAVSNSSTNALDAGLASGTRFKDTSWSLNYSIRDTVNRDDIDTRFENASATLGYALTRKFRVFGTYGHEWNDYPTLPGEETEGAFYSVGFGWAPSRRTSVEIAAGERYTGSTYSATARHRTRATNWNLSYSEGLSDTSRFLPTSGTVYDYLCTDDDGNQVLYTDWPFSFPPSTNCLAFGGTPGVVFDLRSGVFIAKTLRSGVSWGTNKITYSLHYSDSRRLFTTTDAEDRTRAFGVGATYRMTPLTSLSANLTLTNTQVPVPESLALPARDDDWSIFSLGIDHRFAEKLSGALVFRHSKRESNLSAANYDENSITASVNMGF
jgi:uncharacterized protein (PEP-CTERM system associated)